MPTGVGSRIGRGTATAVPSRFSPRHIERPAVKSSQNPFEAEPVMATQGDAAPESRQVAILPSRRRLARMIGIAVAGGTVAGIVVGKLISNGNPEAANLDSLPTAWLDHAQTYTCADSRSSTDRGRSTLPRTACSRCDLAQFRVKRRRTEHTVRRLSVTTICSEGDTEPCGVAIPSPLLQRAWRIDHSW
jgi:hypothetical protein